MLSRNVLFRREEDLHLFRIQNIYLCLFYFIFFIVVVFLVAQVDLDF